MTSIHATHRSNPRSLRFAVLIPLAIAAAPSASAQFVDHPAASVRGLFWRSPKLFLVPSAAVPAEPQRVRVSQPGVTPSGSVDWANGGFVVDGVESPDYSTEAIRAGVVRAAIGGLEPEVFELGSFSTGGDVMPLVDSAGVMVELNDAWWFCSATLRNAGVVGTVRQAWSSLANPSASVVTYYAEGNDGVSPLHRDSLMVENLPEEWGLGALGVGEVTGLDLGGGFVSYFPDLARTNLILDEDRQDVLYFTLTRSCADSFSTLFAALDAANLDDPHHPNGAAVQPLEPDSATVYRMRWMEVEGVLGWHQFAVAFHRAELFSEEHDGLGANGLPAPEEFPALEIDALSVDWRAEADFRAQVIFSTKDVADSNGPGGNPIENEFMIYSKGWFEDQPNADAQAQVARVTTASSDDRLSTKMGINSDIQSGERNDVNGICTGDPGTEGDSPFSECFGIPVQGERAVAPEELGLAVAVAPQIVAQPDGPVDLHFGVSNLAKHVADSSSGIGILVYDIFVEETGTTAARWAPFHFTPIAGAAHTDDHVAPVPTSGHGEVAFRARLFEWPTLSVLQQTPVSRILL